MLPLTFRVIAAISLILSIAMLFVIFQNSKEKDEYEKVSGRLTYNSQQFGELPNRDLGKYRYLKVENYPYVFEVYSDEQSARIDSLKTGEVVTAYYYETSNTHSEGINRFLKFLERDNHLYYVDGSTSKVVGLTVIGICILLTAACYILYKKNKIPY